MRYNDNHERDDLDPSCTEPDALDDRDEPGEDIFADAGWNDPEDASAHL